MSFGLRCFLLLASLTVISLKSDEFCTFAVLSARSLITAKNLWSLHSQDQPPEQASSFLPRWLSWTALEHLQPFSILIHNSKINLSVNQWVFWEHRGRFVSAKSVWSVHLIFFSVFLACCQKFFCTYKSAPAVWSPTCTCRPIAAWIGFVLIQFFKIVLHFNQVLCSSDWILLTVPETSLWFFFLILFLSMITVELKGYFLRCGFEPCRNYILLSCYITLINTKMLVS